MGRFLRHAMQVDMSAAKGANAMHKACMKKQALMKWTKRNHANINIVLNASSCALGLLLRGGVWDEAGVMCMLAIGGDCITLGSSSAGFCAIDAAKMRFKQRLPASRALNQSQRFKQYK